MQLRRIYLDARRHDFLKCTKRSSSKKFLVLQRAAFSRKYPAAQALTVLSHLCGHDLYQHTNVTNTLVDVAAIIRSTCAPRFNARIVLASVAYLMADFESNCLPGLSKLEQADFRSSCTGISARRFIFRWL